MTPSPFWEPFAQAVLETAQSSGPAGFTVDDVPSAFLTPPQVRGSVLGAMTYGGFICPIGRERSRRPERKGGKVDRYVLVEPENGPETGFPASTRAGGETV